MLNNSWFKKQKPFLGFSGFGGGGQGIVLGGASGPTIEASGGILSEYTDPAGDIYRAHIFVGPGDFTVTDIVGDGEIEYMLVAGGGGGGSVNGPEIPWSSPANVTSSGGGAGGFMTNVPGTPLSYSNPVTVEVATYQIIIGYGARSGSNRAPTNGRGGRGMRGGDTSFGGAGIPTWNHLDASGGGGGGSGTDQGGPGVYGGSGGGGTAIYPTFPNGGSTRGVGAANKSPTYGELSPAQGHVGGASAPTSGAAGGGGGAAGAGVAGATGQPSAGNDGNGGDGAQMTIEDGTTTVYYGGGGGGGTSSGPPGAHSPLPGGAGYHGPTDPEFNNYGRGGFASIPSSGPSPSRKKKAIDDSAGTPGGHGFGGGGGGAAQAGRGGTGGHGCCIIRYKISKTTGSSKATGGLISYYPGSPISPTGAVIHTFRAPGTFTTPASFSENCDVWMIGGGGAGGGGGGGGGGAGYILDLPGHPIGGSFSTPVVVGRGGKGGGYDDPFVGYANAAAGHGSKSICPEIYPSSPTGATAGMAGNAGGTRNAYSNPTGDSGPGDAGTGFAGCGGGAASGASSNPPGSPSPVGAPYGGGAVTSWAGTGGGGAGGPGGDCRGITPTKPANYLGGYGGIGVQCPETFRNPLTNVGYPGPNGEGFWFGGGGAGSPWSDNSPTHPAPMSPGYYGGGRTDGSPNGSQLPMINEDPEWGNADFNYSWAGGGNSRGVNQCLNIPISPTIGGSSTKFPEVMRGCGGHAATNSGGGGGAGTRWTSTGMQWNGPSPTYRMFVPQGGDGGPGIVMIAYPQ